MHDQFIACHQMLFFPHWGTWYVWTWERVVESSTIIPFSRSWILPWKRKIDRIYFTCLLKSWHLHVCLQALALGQHWCSLISSVKMPWCLRAILACGVSVPLHPLTPEASQSLQAYQGPFHSPQKSKPDLFIVWKSIKVIYYANWRLTLLRKWGSIVTFNLWTFWKFVIHVKIGSWSWMKGWKQDKCFVQKSSSQ